MQLRRITTSGHWIPEVDGLRLIATAAVILFHLNGQLLRQSSATIAPRYHGFALFLGNGNRGVQLFFLISGFILALPFARHRLTAKPRPSLRKYFARRLTRLGPPYVVNLFFAAVALVFIENNSVRSVLPHLFASLFYLHNLIFREPSTINAVAWSLEVEVQFYLVAPLLALLFLIRNALTRRFITVASMVAIALVQIAFDWGQNTLASTTLAGQLQFFLAGLLLADLFLTVIHRWKHDWRWDLVSLAGWPAVFLLDERFMALWLPFLVLLLYVAALRGVVISAILRNTLVAVAGGMCYTIYLWHPLVIAAANRICKRYPVLYPTDYAGLFLVQGVIKFAAVGAVCGVFYLYLERPCMDPKWPRKLGLRLRDIFSSNKPAVSTDQPEAL
jgi:peptidoglycan/LPS O-acetylase OafA/YrhL